MKLELDHLVALAVAENPRLEGMGPVLEKELLHYDILLGLHGGGFLNGLVFNGGTALRLCHGAARFSEDLDFDAGTGFTCRRMPGLEACIRDCLTDRYGLETLVQPPKARRREGPSVDTWRISIVTRPGRPDLPRQHIHLDISNMPAHSGEPATLRRNFEGLPDGIEHMVLQVRSKDGILADKLVAFPATLDRKNLRWRDLWDMCWLTQNGAELNTALVQARARDFRITDFTDRLAAAAERTPELIGSDGFINHLSRFLDRRMAEATVRNPEWRESAAREIRQLLTGLRERLADGNWIGGDRHGTPACPVAIDRPHHPGK